MTTINYEPVITVSATYGAGGSVVAPRLASDMGLPFVDRLISASAATASQEGLVEGEEEPTPAGRFLSYFARAAAVGAVIGPDPEVQEDIDIRSRAEADLRPLRDGAPGVVLGRAAAVVLRDRPRAFHVRLDGAATRRVAWAAGYEHLSPEDAEKRRVHTDRARTSYVKRLYRTDPRDAGLYHLVVDPTVIGVDSTVEVVELAAAAFFSR